MKENLPSRYHIVRFLTITISIFVTLCSSCAFAYEGHHAKSTWAKTVCRGKKHKTTLEFYYHDVIVGESPTTVLIASANKGTYGTPLAFGNLFMFDDPLTVGPDPTSKLVGRAQGMYGSDSLGSVGLIMAVGFTFNEGIYNGSSISILVQNPITNKHNREFPIVGGTGLFRMAQGYALPNTYMSDLSTGNAIVGYNVTIFHQKRDYHVSM